MLRPITARAHNISTLTWFSHHTCHLLLIACKSTVKEGTFMHIILRSGKVPCNVRFTCIHFAYIWFKSTSRKLKSTFLDCRFVRYELQMAGLNIAGLKMSAAPVCLYWLHCSDRLDSCKSWRPAAFKFLITATSNTREWMVGFFFNTFSRFGYILWYVFISPKLRK